MVSSSSRRVPLSVQLVLLFGGPYARGGWTFLGIVLVFFWLFKHALTGGGFGAGGFIAVIVFGIFLAVTGYMIISGFLQGMRALRPLETGTVAYGYLRTIEPINANMGDKQMLKVTYTFTTPKGQSHEVSMHTLTLRSFPAKETVALIDGDKNRALKLPFSADVPDEGREPLLYLPRDPAQATVLAALPCRISLDNNGQLTGAGTGATFLALFPMLATLLVHGTVALLQVVTQ